ncbi:MAG: MFS transporter [Thermoplasmata archaeon]|nr:MAG: MFS transporter [Thermoplasmata archaeon]
MEDAQPKKGFFRQFSKSFWIINSLELFERGAYYGTMSIWAVHARENLGIAPSIIGILYATLIIFLYFMPLVAAALAEKYGYRNVLIVAFIVLIIGYICNFLVQAGQMGFFFIALIFWGVGAGAFKPIISASIAHVTREDQRNLAYSIYYWMINLGAFLLPLAIHFRFGSQSMWAYVFLISAGLIFVNLMITLFLYKSPVHPLKDLSVGKAIRRIIPALKDKKFVLLLLIYSGFWFMFAISHSFLPIYMRDFNRMPDWFSPQLLATINPGTIILVGPFLGKLVEKHKSLNMVMLGLVIFAIGILIIGFSNSPILFAVGIVVFSFGEFITHPGFIAYVSKIAPKNMIAIYMACIFIATGTGNAVGGAIQGFWYEHYAVNLGMPKIYFGLIASVGLITLICFILYNRWIIRDSLREDPQRTVDTGIWTKTTTIAIVLLFIPITIGVAYAGGPNTYYGDEEEGRAKTDWTQYEVLDNTMSDSGYLGEGAEFNSIINLTEPNVVSVIFTLTWQDEPAAYPTHTNDPDDFSMSITKLSSGKVMDSGVSFSGNIEVEWTFQPQNDPYYNGSHEYEITITCVYAGDHQPTVIDPFGIRTVPDDGNDWSLAIEYEYYETKVG